MVVWPWAVLIFVGLCCSWDHVDVGDLCYLPETVVLSGSLQPPRAKSGSRDLLQPEAMLISMVQAASKDLA